MLYRLYRFVIKEFIQLFRDRLLAPFVLLGPLLEVLLIGWSTTHGITELPTAILDMDRTPLSRELITAVGNVETYAPYSVGSMAELRDHVDRGRALAAWIIPQGFQAEVLDGNPRPGRVQLVVDGADVLASQTAIEVGRGLVGRYGRNLAARIRPGNDRAPPIDSRLLVWYNPGLEEANYMIPSEVGFIAAAIAAMLASMAIAREREMGTLEQLLVTPLRSAELILGKSVMAIGLGYTEFLLMLALVTAAFDVPMRGSLPLLLALALFYMVVELGWGLMISAVAHNQMQALLIAFAVVMMMTVFSGYAYPVEMMPLPMQWLSNLFPLKHWLIAFRSILLRGAGLAELWPQVLAIGGLGVLIYAGTIALLSRRRLE